MLWLANWLSSTLYPCTLYALRFNRYLSSLLLEPPLFLLENTYQLPLEKQKTKEMSSASSVTVTITSAADEQEVTYLSRARMLHRIRIGIAVLLLGASAGVVGAESAPLHYYNETKGYSSLFLPLWPLNLDIRQTNALLACGAVILFQAFVYIGVAVFPSVRHPSSSRPNSELCS